jgi:hypothetical protein
VTELANHHDLAVVGQRHHVAPVASRQHEEIVLGAGARRLAAIALELEHAQRKQDLGG